MPLEPGRTQSFLKFYAFISAFTLTSFNPFIHTQAKELKYGLTPRNSVAYLHLVFNVVDFDNKQVKVNSLDEHPTESGH